VVVGRSSLIVRLFVWALAVVAIDGVVIARGSDDDKPVTQPAQSAAAETSTTAAAGENPTSTLATAPVATASSSSEVSVAHLHADGDTLSSVGFHVEGRWQLRWRVDQGGNGVAATVDDDDTGEQKLFTGLTPGEGSTEVATGCNCTLHLTPDGSAYDVLVVDVEG
jgi:hypothetical protein